MQNWDVLHNMNCSNFALNFSESSRGNAAEEILKIANGKDATKLVIGSKGKYGTSKDLLGGTSYKLIHYSRCTVTVVK